MRSVEDLVFRARMEGVSETTRELGNLGRAFEDLGQKSSADIKAAGLERLATTTGALSNKLLGLGGAGVAALGMLGKAAMDAENAMARMKTAFDGNEKAARAAYTQLKRYADVTPFGTSEVVAAGAKLQGVGLPYQKWTELAGQMAAANQKPLMQAVEAIVDAQSGQYERMLEFNIRPDTLVPYGGTGKGGSGQGAEGIKKNMDALEQHINTKWSTAMANAAKTVAGQWSTLEGGLESLGSSFGQFLLPEMMKFVQWSIKMVDKVNALDDAAKGEIVTFLKWGTAITLGVAGLLRLASIIATVKLAMMGSQIAQARTIALQKAETAAVREGVVAYNEKAYAETWAATAGSKGAAASAARSSLWSKGGLLRLGGGALGLGMVAGGFYMGMKDAQQAERERQQGLWHNPTNAVVGALMASGGAMLAVKSLLNTDLKTTLIVGVAAGILYGFSRLAGKYDARFSVEGIKDTIQAAVSGGFPSSAIDKTVLKMLGGYFEGRASGIASAAIGAFGEAEKGTRLLQDPYGNIIRRDTGYNQAAQDTTAIMHQISHGNVGGLMGYVAGQTPQSGRVGAMESQYGRMQATAAAGLREMAGFADMAVHLAERAKFTEIRTGKKPIEDYYGVAGKAMDVLEDSTRKFAEGLRDAAQAIRDARMDIFNRQLKAVGDTLSAIDAELLPESMLESARQRRDAITARMYREQMASGQDLDAADLARDLNMTHLREKRSDQQDAIDEMMEDLALLQGEYSLRRDVGDLKGRAAREAQASMPRLFEAGGPTIGDMVGIGRNIYDALKAMDPHKAEQFSQDFARWRLGLLKDQDKRNPNIAREILSTGGVSGLAEAEISQVVSGGYFGTRRQGVFGPYRLSGAAASRVRASTSQENEKHVRIDMYLHPDAGAMDDLANAATTQVIRTLPKAFRGEGFTLQMQP